MVELTGQTFDIGMVVRNADAMLSFYRDALGLEPARKIRRPDGMLNLFKLGAQHVKLFVPDVIPEGRAAPGDLMESTGIRYWSIFVADIDPAVKTLCDGGGSLVRPIQEGAPGVRFCIVGDPDGNCLELIEYSTRSS